MNKIEIDYIISQKFSDGYNNLPKVIKKIIYKTLNNLLFIDKINYIIERNSQHDAVHFLNDLFDYLNFSCLISNKDLQKIPAEGRLICVANHPIGSLDSLSLLKTFLDIRPDVKIVANEILNNFDFLKQHLLPVDIYSKTAKRSYISAIHKSLEEENVVIMFPAASVSRLSWFRVVDSEWHKGTITLSRKFQTPVLPVFIDAKNSWLFYTVSIINKNLSTLLLSYELFNKQDKTIRIKIGYSIPHKVFTHSYINDKYQIKLLKKHVYLMGKKDKTVYATEKNIIRPIDRRLIKKELNSSRLLSYTSDNIQIYITTKKDSPNCLNEIARLREITFRKVGEGTGKKLDLDGFDSIYSHLIVWDDRELEIIGSYRIGFGKEIFDKYGVEGFYTSTLFSFSKEFEYNYLQNSIELGRSFVQKKYWNTNALNYLWLGIGALIAENNSYKYLFGGVSISNSYPAFAKELIVFYYKKWYGGKENLVKPNNSFSLSKSKELELPGLFDSGSVKRDYKILKNILRQTNCSTPVLYKHYSDLCEDGGVSFLGFGVDKNFENCIDGLILVDINLIKPEKKNRYIKSFSSLELKKPA